MLFGLDTLPPPVACLTRIADGGVADAGWWLRLDPVHLLIAGDRLILADPPTLRLTRNEADRLVAPIQHLFAGDGWHVEVLDPNRWYLRLPQSAAIETAPLPVVTGHDIHPFLPKGAEAPAWRRYLNEIQMLLATSQVNAEREARGEPIINSVWLWGEGGLSSVPERRWVRTWGDDVLVRGLASFTKTPISPVPVDANAWLAQAEAGEHLLVLGPDTLGHIDRDWFKPVLKSLRASALERASFYGDVGPGFMLRAEACLPWWRAGLRWLVRSHPHRLT